MKIRFFWFWLALVGLESNFAQEDWTPTGLKLHETRWEKRDKNGNELGSFVEIQSGLNRQLENGEWIRSSDELEIIAGGVVVEQSFFCKLICAGDVGSGFQVSMVR